MKIEEALSYDGMRFIRAHGFKKTRVNQRIDLEHTVKEMLIRAPYLLSDVIYFRGGTSLDPAPAFVMWKVNQRVDEYQDAPGIGITQRWIVRGTRPLTMDERTSIDVDDNNYYDWNSQLATLIAVSHTLSSPFDFCKYIDVEIAVKEGTLVKQVNNNRLTGNHRYNNKVDWLDLQLSNGYTEKTRKVVSYGDYAMILNKRGAQQMTMIANEPETDLGCVDSSLFKHRVQNGLHKTERVWSGWIPDRYYESKVIRVWKDERLGVSVELKRLKGTLCTLPAKRPKTKDYFVDFTLVIPSESQISLGGAVFTLEAGEYMFNFNGREAKDITEMTEKNYKELLKRTQLQLTVKPLVSRLNSLSKIGEEVNHSEHSIKTRPIHKAEEADAQPTAYNRVNTNRLG